MAETVPTEFFDDDDSYGRLKEYAPTYSRAFWVLMVLGAFTLFFWMWAGSLTMMVVTVVWVGLALWVAGDAITREGMAPHIWMAIVLVAGILGLLLYLALRHDHDQVSLDEWNPETGELTPDRQDDTEPTVDRVCPDCGQVLEADDRTCSACGGDVSTGAAPN